MGLLPVLETGHITFGSLNNFCKVNEPVLKLWARVLRLVSNSRLVLLTHMGSHRQHRHWNFLHREGITADRVTFVQPCPRRAYLELYHRLDIVLDTFPYNGHPTSLDALWMGVPVVSFAGDRTVSRAGLSQLSNLNLPELVARSKDDYVHIATRLAANLPRLAELRPEPCAHGWKVRCSWMLLTRFARGIEAAYRKIWQHWCVRRQRLDGAIAGSGWHERSRPGEQLAFPLFPVSVSNAATVPHASHRPKCLRNCAPILSSGPTRGRLGTFCQRILAAQPNHAGSLYLLGVIASQMGQLPNAAEMIRRAIEQEAANAVYHDALGLVLAAQGQLEAAVASSSARQKFNSRRISQ